jgi:ubiquinone/menaquinone biosynthesis C-methylase UbiE
MLDFDDKAKTWDSDPVKVERAFAVAAAIRQQVPLSTAWSALEYGCGTGLLSFALRPYLGQLTLADSSPGMLAVLAEKIAAAKASNMQPIQLDLTTDSLPADRYDLIYTLMTLHHVEDIDRILGDFRALLRSRGRLCMADLDLEDGSFHGAGFTGHKGFDRETLWQQLLKAGFGDVEFLTCYILKKATDRGIRNYPLFLAVATRI